MREIAPFGLRMPAELKERIDREAKANGRSMNTEIISRLWASLELGQQRVMEPAIPTYVGGDLSNHDRELLSVFRRMPAEKQIALLLLIK